MNPFKSGDNKTNYLPVHYSVNKIVIDDTDVRNLVKSIIIEEGINSGVMSVKISLLDTIGYLQEKKVTGGESVEISLTKKQLEGEINLDISLMVAEVKDFGKDGFSRQAYAIQCVSKHVYMNSTKTLKRHFSGTIGAIIKNILSSDLNVNTSDVNESTSKNIVGIFPNLKPLKACVWLAEKANANGYPFYFYESLMGGMILKSYSDMKDGEVQKSYNDFPLDVTEPGTPENYKSVSEGIIKIGSPLNMSLLQAVETGCYSSTLVSLDTSNKTYNKNFADYEPNKRMGVNSPFKTGEISGKNIESMYTNKQHHILLNSKLYDKNNVHSTTQDNKHKLASVFNSLHYMTHEVEVPGDLRLKAGDIVEISITSMGIDKQRQNIKPDIDEMMSGKYMIVKLSNIFEDKHIQVLTLQKDYSGVKL